MENQVNRVLLQIPMPDEMDGTQINADELLEKLKVEEIASQISKAKSN